MCRNICWIGTSGWTAHTVKRGYFFKMWVAFYSKNFRSFICNKWENNMTPVLLGSLLSLFFYTKNNYKRHQLLASVLIILVYTCEIYKSFWFHHFSINEVIDLLYVEVWESSKWFLRCVSWSYACKELLWIVWIQWGFPALRIQQQSP